VELGGIGCVLTAAGKVMGKVKRHNNHISYRSMGHFQMCSLQPKYLQRLSYLIRQVCPVFVDGIQIIVQLFQDEKSM
jgi:hypothetical protein